MENSSHAKIHAGIANAEFRILPDIPEDLRIGLFQPTATYQAIVRLSNASGAIQSDATRDLRGVAIRVVKDRESIHDFLMTDAPSSHARDARQFMIAAEAMGSRWKIMILPRLLYGLGIRETWRMIRALRNSPRKIDSLATDQFWSRAPIRFGPYAVKFTLQPSESASGGVTTSGENYLREDFIERLQRRPITFDFRVQRYVDEVKTPIEDGTVEWKSGTTKSVCSGETRRNEMLASCPLSDSLVMIHAISLLRNVSSHCFSTNAKRFALFSGSFLRLEDSQYS